MSRKKIIRNTVLHRYEYDYNMFNLHYPVIRVVVIAPRKIYLQIEPPMSGRSAEDREFDRESSLSSKTESMDSITRQVGVRANLLANMLTNTSV